MAWPPNLFYGTGIPACILVLDKENAHARTGIFMIDASKRFLKDGNKNRLRAQDIHQIVDVFNRQREVPRYARMIPLAEIASPANDYNLNIPRYIESSEPEDLHDLDAHLNGGIPDRDLDTLDAYWQVFPSLRQALFVGNGRAGYNETRVETQQLKATILEHLEFRSYVEQIMAIFETWQETHKPLLWGLEVNARPRTVIDALSADLLSRFSELPLLNTYDVYQRLMDYWDDVMQDDVFLIATASWIEAAQPRGIIEDMEKKIRETPDLTIKGRKYKMDLVPLALIVARYFDTEQSVVVSLQVKQETVSRALEEFMEEHSSEGGLLEDAVNDKGKVTLACVNRQLKVIQGEGEPEDGEERATLTRCLALMEAESKASKAVKEAQDALDQRVISRYTKLSETEVKTLVVEDKWFASIRADIEGQVQGLTHQLAGSVNKLEERYARPLPELEREVEEFRVARRSPPEADGANVGMKAEACSSQAAQANRPSQAKPTASKQEVFGATPADWNIRALGDIGQCLIGLTYDPDNIGSNGVLVLRSSNIRDGLPSVPRRCICGNGNT